MNAVTTTKRSRASGDINVSELFMIYDAALEGHMKGATNLKTLKRHLHGRRFHSLKEFYSQNKLSSLQSAFNVIVQRLCDLVKRDVAMKDMCEIYVEAFMRMQFFFTLHQTFTSDEDFVSLISATQSLFCMLAVYGFVEDLFLSFIEITENPIAELSKRAGASFWTVEKAKGFLAFRKCKKMFIAELDADTTIKEPHFFHTDLTQISEGTRELLVYSDVDIKRTIILSICSGQRRNRREGKIFKRCQQNLYS